MNDHSKQKSVNSRRSFIAGFGGVLAAAAAPQKQRWAEVLNVKVSWFQQVHRPLGIQNIIFSETASPFM